MGQLNYKILQINGPDRSGLFTQICQYLADQNVNITDISQNVLKGYLGITFLIDISNSTINYDRLRLGFGKLCRHLNLQVNFFDYPEDMIANKRLFYILSVVGEDKPGTLAQMSRILADNKANIVTINVRILNKQIYINLLLDLAQVDKIKLLREKLMEKCAEIGLSMVLQKESVYRRNKKLIVFDMDSTLVLSETIVDIAKLVGKEQEMHEQTEFAMQNNMDYVASLQERLKLIQGVKQEDLQQIANNINITPGTDKLISTLKTMGWKVAIVSSGFSIFAEEIKNRLNIDYAFGNTLEIKDGAITGRVLGDIIDGEGKWEIVEEIASQLNLHSEEIVTVGDGSNDSLMLERSGLGIGLNSKKILDNYSDGKFLQNHASNILLMVGLSETQIDEIFHNEL
jgi:phosphoserine phosphatase